MSAFDPMQTFACGLSEYGQIVFVIAQPNANYRQLRRVSANLRWHKNCCLP